MVDDKVHCMVKAKEYEFDYWDGDRRYGYGGYKYDGRWKVVAEKLIAIYRLPRTRNSRRRLRQSALLYELKKLLPNSHLRGLRRLAPRPGRRPRGHSRQSVPLPAQDAYPFGDKHFDLVISMGCLHNLRLFELKTALREIQRVGKNGTSCWKATATNRNCSTCNVGR